ncbi:hypothetical protein CAPTEDRAFT_214326 [Capitella teleta]|uniref:G-protein coupled receptors family 1 profile domain-containing protein n=1 Tax=Capitella teleta TaxID=283909 RepID=R7VJS4_CAPTE|nr:hypothetical protein CAPTEDRAFT_214326 [Capitella teleta]|eukprot:ELU16160.1 hypothetical protein CAPTEDRAFT_214326 [Capitella teleta]
MAMTMDEESHEIVASKDQGYWLTTDSTFLIVLACLVSVVGVLLNLIIACILTRERIWQEANRNAFLLNMIVANLFGAMNFGMYAVVLMGSDNSLICMFFIYTIQWTYQTSWFSLMLQMLDQYLCIEWPLKYPIWMTDAAIKALIVTSWILPSVHSVVFKWGIDGEAFCANQLDNEQIRQIGLYIIMTIFVIPLPIATTINLRILILAKRRASEVAVIRVASSSRPANDQRLMVSLRVFKQIWRSILTATIVVGTLVLTLLPTTAIVIDSIVNPPTALHQLKIKLLQFSIGFVIVGATFIACPLIYSLRVAQVKKFYLGAWRKVTPPCGVRGSDY